MGSTGAASGDADKDGTTGWEEKEFFYTVLNLPTTATAQEIRDRYRSLSVVFHPDKQHEREESEKQTALKRFYEVQRAYEVLSDPFLRVVYDTLGYQGLSLQHLPELRELPSSELQNALISESARVEVEKQEALVRAQGTVTYGVDLSPLLKTSLGLEIWKKEWWNELDNGLYHVKMRSFAVKHSFESDLGPQTHLRLVSRMGEQLVGPEDDPISLRVPVGFIRRPNSYSVRMWGNVTAHVEHRLSSNWTIQGSTNFVQQRLLGLSAIYANGDNNFTVQSQVVTAMFTNGLEGLEMVARRPPLVFTYGRKLFKNSLHNGVVSLNLAAPLPCLSLALVKPCALSKPLKEQRSLFSGRQIRFERLATGYHLGLDLKPFGTGPALRTEYTVGAADLGLSSKVAAEYSLLGGLGASLLGRWTSVNGTATGAEVSISGMGIELRASVTYLGQTIVIPLLLATEFSPLVSLSAVVLPTTAFVIANHFYLAPERKRMYRKRRKMALEDSEEGMLKKKREAEETSGLLREAARRNMEVERGKNGLVIASGEYVTVKDEPDDEELSVDVTIALQALVQNSQLFIAGNRSKGKLAGFYQVLPESEKVLRVRYMFRGRMHYAQVGDMEPLVLPMQEHVMV